MQSINSTTSSKIVNCPHNYLAHRIQQPNPKLRVSFVIDENPIKNLHNLERPCLMRLLGLGKSRISQISLGFFGYLFHYCDLPYANFGLFISLV